MKGATALPWASNNKPPKISSITKMGSSQNFFRTRRNAQNSFTNDDIWSPPYSKALKLIRHSLGRRPRRTPLNPVTGSAGIQGQPQGIFTEQPEDQRCRRDYEEKEQPHDDRIDNLA